VAPLARNRIRSSDNLFVDDKSTADAGAKDDAKYNGVTTSGSVSRFRKSEAICVVGEPNRSSQPGFNVTIKRLADETG
jgi:hypothetical protein